MRNGRQFLPRGVVFAATAFLAFASADATVLKLVYKSGEGLSVRRFQYTQNGTNWTVVAWDAASGITYSGAWVAEDCGSVFHKYTSTANAYVQFTFTGTGVRWENDGTAGQVVDIYIDGNLQETKTTTSGTGCLKLQYEETDIGAAAPGGPWTRTGTKVSLVETGDYVGIGLSQPAFPLHLANSNESAQLCIASPNNRAFSQIQFDGTGGRNYSLGVGNQLADLDINYKVKNKFYIFDFNALAMRLVIDESGKIGVGTAQPTAALDVTTGAGDIKCNKLTINGWTLKPADYVFERSYQLRDLKEVEKFIAENKHLPDVPSGAAMKKDGVDVVEMNMVLLRKVEELTLYTIELQKRIEVLEGKRKFRQD